METTEWWTADGSEKEFKKLYLLLKSGEAFSSNRLEKNDTENCRYEMADGFGSKLEPKQFGMLRSPFLSFTVHNKDKKQGSKKKGEISKNFWHYHLVGLLVTTMIIVTRITALQLLLLIMSFWQDTCIQITMNI